eukprot:693652-Amphidinium_carterae.1
MQHRPPPPHNPSSDPQGVRSVAVRSTVPTRQHSQHPASSPPTQTRHATRFLYFHLLPAWRVEQNIPNH